MTRSELESLVGAIARQLGNPEFKTGEFGKSATAAPPRIVKPEAIPWTLELRGLARLMDHTLLKPNATREDIERLCEEAIRCSFAAACVNPFWTSLVGERLRGSSVRVATVVGFPLGATRSDAKRAEAESALLAGAEEIDMVMNVGALCSGDHILVQNDLRGVIEICHAASARVKVILETSYLTDQQKVIACRLAEEAGADYVKTSTGFGPGGANEADVRLLRGTLGPEVGVKAAGGIRTLDEALGLLRAGASRLGTSASVAILAEAAERLSSAASAAYRLGH